MALEPKPASADSRRTFLKTSSAVALSAGVVGSMAIPRTVHAQGSDVLKIGLVGCGGRGTGAAINAMKADANCKLVALGDAFEDRLTSAKRGLKGSGGDKYDVKDENCFVGFDAYKNVIDSDVDVVVLATPPHFRPMQYRYGVEKGKHMFVEKPVCVDAPGYRHILETNKMAEEKNLAVVSGLCWRYDKGVLATMEQIKNGAIGDIVAVQSNYNAGTLWHRGDDPKWSRMEYQMRNWLYFTWLSGDHNCEQHVHSLDKTAWLMDDKSPVRAMGLGGRQQRVDSKFGNIYDHHAVAYEYANGARVFAYCRQMDGTSNDVDEYVIGTKGKAQILAHKIEGEKPWSYNGPKPNMYDEEHRELFASIRSGTPIRNGAYMANSSMIAVMGRMCTYTGQTLTWDQVINSQEKLGPETYAWGDVPAPEVAIPGKTKFV